MEDRVPTKIFFGMRNTKLEDVVRECEWLKGEVADIPLQDERTSYRLVQANEVGNGRYRIMEYQSFDELTKDEQQTYDSKGKPLSWAEYGVSKGKLIELRRGSLNM